MLRILFLKLLEVDEIRSNQSCKFSLRQFRTIKGISDEKTINAQNIDNFLYFKAIKIDQIDAPSQSILTINGSKIPLIEKDDYRGCYCLEAYTNASCAIDCGLLLFPEDLYEISRCMSQK